MKKQKGSALSNVKIAIVFFAFLIIIVAVSLIFKTIDVVMASKFEDSKRFTLSISDGKNLEVVSLSPSSKNIEIFKLSGDIKPAEVGRFLEIPIDGFISFPSLNLNQKINSTLMSAILNCNKIKTNLTIIDFLKLMWLAKSIPESSVDIIQVGNAAGEPDKIIGRLVTDDFIEKDNQTIQIINATSVNGLGSRLAKLISNMGGNVIFVMTENNQRKKSSITYIDKKTYTIEKLQKVLGYEVVKEPNNALSDITIIIGEDKLDALPF